MAPEVAVAARVVVGGVPVNIVDSFDDISAILKNFHNGEKTPERREAVNNYLKKRGLKSRI